VSAQGQKVTFIFDCFVPLLSNSKGNTAPPRRQTARQTPGRRLNGDETPEWKALRGGNCGIQHVKLHRHRCIHLRRCLFAGNRAKSVS
jgi:hypothetical protein